MIKPLGILLFKKEVVNHRSLLKITINPILMVFGIMLASNMEGYEVKSIIIIKTSKQLNVFRNIKSHLFECNEYDAVLKIRRLF